MKDWTSKRIKDESVESEDGDCHATITVKIFPIFGRPVGLYSSVTSSLRTSDENVQFSYSTWRNMAKSGKRL